LRARSLEITDFLLGMGAKAIVVACNTASAAGLEHLRALRNVPVVGLVPAVKPAVASTRTGTIGVLSTQATIRGRLLSDVIERFAMPAGVEVVKAAPVGLVEAVEAGELDAPQTAKAVSDAVLPMLAQGVDAIVLGCTHYPFLTHLIRDVAGEGVQIIDSGQGVARQTHCILQAHNLLREPVDPSHQGKLTVYTSADPHVMHPIVVRLIGEEVDVMGDEA
jgi:glutamate racemase